MTTYAHEPDFRDAKIHISSYNGELCIRISKYVAASYHDKADTKKHYTTTYFSERDLLCCACSCGTLSKAEGECSVHGSQSTSTSSKDDRQGCVHSNALPYGLTIELHKGLAEHILAELCVRNKSLKLPDSPDLRKHISNLSAAAHRKQKPSTSISDMLDVFAMGTDKWKSSPGTPKPASVRALRECKFVSPEKKVKSIHINSDDEDIQICDQDLVDDYEQPVHNDGLDDKTRSYIYSAISIDALNFIAHDKYHHLISKKNATR